MMKERRNDMVAVLKREVDELPEKERNAMLWLIKNYREMETICCCALFTPEKRAELTGRAVDDENMLLLVFVLWEQRFAARKVC